MINALVNTGQEHLAELLDPTLTQHLQNRADCDQREITEVDFPVATIAQKSVGEKVDEIRTFLFGILVFFSFFNVCFHCVYLLLSAYVSFFVN